MQITEITYRELVNTGNYNNITVEMKASLSKDDNLEMCMTKLTKKVKRSIKDIQEGED